MPVTPNCKTAHALRRHLSPCATAIALALACSLAPTLALSQTAAADPAASRFAAAMQHYETNHWPQAYAAMAALADQGHPEAQRVALLMWHHGRALYGTSFSATAAQRQRWAQGQRPQAAMP